MSVAQPRNTRNGKSFLRSGAMRDSFTEERPAPVMGKFRGVLISPDVFVIDAGTVRGKQKERSRQLGAFENCSRNAVRNAGYVRRSLAFCCFSGVLRTRDICLIWERRRQRGVIYTLPVSPRETTITNALEISSRLWGKRKKKTIGSGFRGWAWVIKD